MKNNNGVMKIFHNNKWNGTAEMKEKREIEIREAWRIIREEKENQRRERPREKKNRPHDSNRRRNERSVSLSKKPQSKYQQSKSPASINLRRNLRPSIISRNAWKKKEKYHRENEEMKPRRHHRRHLARIFTHGMKEAKMKHEEEAK